jgi:threonine dehydrogenase-like Zn-dependent dehydrogenase
MYAAVLTEYGTIRWHEVADPRIGEDEVLVRVTYAGICGSDQHVFRGEFHPRTSTPLIQGHEFGGRIEAVGEAVTGFAPGDRVAVDPIFWCGTCPACTRKHYPACRSLKLLGIDTNGGFGQYVAAKAFMLHRLEDTVSDRHAALIEMLSIGFHACRRAGVAPGDTVAVFGAGRIGQAILQAVRTITRSPLFLVDVLPGRLAAARRAYPDIVAINAREEDPVSAIRDGTSGNGVDIALEAVGHAHAIPGQHHPVRQAVDAIRGAGTVCVLGLADDPVPLVMKDLIFKEATLVTSRVTHGEFADAIEHLARGDLKPDAMISCELPASRAQEAFHLLDTDPDRYLKILLKIP